MEPFPPLKHQNGVPLDQVRVSNLVVECIVGIYDSERTTPQNIRLDVCLYTDVSAASNSSCIEDALDYSKITREVSFLIQEGAFLLIESAAEVICRFLFLKYHSPKLSCSVVACCVRISKLQALPNGAVPSVQITRTLEQLPTLGLESSTTLFSSNSGRSIHFVTLKPLQTISLTDSLLTKGFVALLPLGLGLTVDGQGLEDSVMSNDSFSRQESTRTIKNTKNHQVSFLFIDKTGQKHE